MTLQHLLKELINNSFENGYDDLVKGLKHSAKIVPSKERKYVDNFILYLNRLYFEESVDVVGDTLKYKDLSLETLSHFKNYCEEFGCVHLKFCIEFIEYKLDHVSGMRGIRKSS